MPRITLQAVASRQLGTIANILSRLPVSLSLAGPAQLRAARTRRAMPANLSQALQDARNFAALPHAGATHQLVLSKQYASLEALLGKLHASL